MVSILVLSQSFPDEANNEKVCLTKVKLREYVLNSFRAGPFLVADSNSAIPAVRQSVSHSVTHSLSKRLEPSSGHFETDWSQRDPQAVQCVQVCTVLYILKLIGPKGTHRLYSLYSFVQFEHFETDWS